MVEQTVQREPPIARCCIVGGGPAGMMLGFLLARAGIDVVVLEKHKDFLRDFRGDTIHPSTLEIMHELGLLEEFLKLPHQEVRHLTGQIGDAQVRIADFSHLPTTCKFIALMPQWDFLNFLAAKADRYPAFRLRMEAEVTDLMQDGERVVGVRGNDPTGTFEIRARVVIGADGRHSVVRARGGLDVDDLGAPMDVLWMRLPRRAEDGEETLGLIEIGRLFVRLNRGDYWQCALAIPKGSAEEIRRRGLPAFRDTIAEVAPFARDRLHELKSWDDIKLLTVKVDRARQWYRPGLLCIGDAAHAMSPIGGVGINLAIQDAVAAANVLAEPLRAGRVELRHLRAVQRRRELPIRILQGLQSLAHRRIVAPAVGGGGLPSPPPPVRALLGLRIVRNLPARIIGFGIWPVHVRP